MLGVPSRKGDALWRVEFAAELAQLHVRRRVVREEAGLVCGIPLEVLAELGIVMQRLVGGEPQQTLLRPLA